MADLSGRRGDRGQILLVAAFALGVTFVGLALVVNSAIYTENLATRGEVSGSYDSLEQRHEIEQSVGAALEYVNTHNFSSQSELSDSIEDNVENISRQVSAQQLTVSRSVNVSLNTGSTIDGDRIAQENETGLAFTSASGTDDWDLASDVRHTRAITMNVSKVNGTREGQAFSLVANETSGPNWELTVWEPSPNDVWINVTTGNGDYDYCDRTVSDDQFTLDVTGGTFDGEPCPALEKLSDGSNMSFATGVGSGYLLQIRNGTNIAGNYSMVVDAGSLGNLHGSPDHSPYVTGAIYEVTVDYAFVTQNVRYETEIDVAPGEPT